MNFLAINDNVKFIIIKYSASDLKIRTQKIKTFKKYYLDASCLTTIYVNIEI